MLVFTQKNRRWLVNSISLTLIICLSAWFKPAFAQPSPASAPPALPVIVAPVKLESKTQPLETLGTLKAIQSIEIRANVSEILQQIFVQDGQMVKQGDLLFELSDQQELALLEQAKVVAAEAKRQYERAKKLRGQGNITEAVIDEKQAQWKSAQAEIAIIEAQIADRKIYAPFSGQVGLLNVSRGDLINANNTLTTLDDTSKLYVDLQIPSQYLGSLSLNQTVHIFPPTPATMGKRLERNQAPIVAKIIAISPRLDPQTRLLPVRARIDEPQGLVSGMVVKSQLQLQPESKLWITNSSILMVGEKQFVYRLKQADLEVSSKPYSVEKVEIELGERLAQYSAVIQGLSAGDIIISQGVLRVSPKSQVSIKAIEGQTPDEDLLKPNASKNREAAK